MPTSRILRLCAVLLLGGAFLAPQAHAQLREDLDVFGFFQTQLRYSQEQGGAGNEKLFSFSVQQLNVFAASQLDDNFSAFVNAELTNSFASERNFGSLRLEEAWVRYNRNSAFNVKAGLLVPTFNNLNEIKNRTPLLPYVIRPIAYETSYAGVLPIRHLVPDQAYVQAYGSVPVGPTRLDYAAFAGNSESNFSAPKTAGTMFAGIDTSMTKMVGGRIGARFQSLKVGVSASYDDRNLQTYTLGSSVIPIGLGPVNRTRLGADLTFNRGRLFGEAEAILVSHETTEEQNAKLDFLATSEFSPLRGVITDDLGMSFYHAMLGVNVTDQVYAYGMVDYLEDRSTSAFAAGLDMYSVGLGYRPIDAVVVKGQYVHAGTRENPLSDYTGDAAYLAVSVSF